MKTTAIMLFLLTAIFAFALFYTNKFETSLNKEGSRDSKFSSILRDETYRNEFMNVMGEEYPKEILSPAFNMTDNNRRLQSQMMNHMVAMGYSDPAMSEMMIGMTMNMCDLDKDICKKMSYMLLNNPPAMECMMTTMYKKGIIDKNTLDKTRKKMQIAQANIFDYEDFTYRP